MIENYKQAIEKTKIPRIPWKAILGMSFTEYIKRNKFINNDNLIHNIMVECRKRSELLFGWNWADVHKNIKIGVSARRAEQKIYQ